MQLRGILMDTLADSLRKLIADSKERAFCDPQWIEEELRRLHGDDSRIWVLVISVEEEVPRLISASTPAETLSFRLQVTRGLDACAAAWAVATWGIAVGASSGLKVATLPPAPCIRRETASAFVPRRRQPGVRQWLSVVVRQAMQMVTPLRDAIAG